MKIYLLSLGCDKNLADSEAMLGLLHNHNHEIATGPDVADIIIVNTCGFIQAAVEEGIAALLEMAKFKADGACRLLIATGCMAERYRNQMRTEIPELDAILGTNELHKIVELIEPTKIGEITEEEMYENRYSTMPMHVVYVKISDGCDNHCTYCTIPSIKGAYRDRDFDSILRECQKLAKNGAREIVVVAQDTTLYGTEKYGKKRLHELLREIAKIEEITWVRLLYAYPEHIYSELITEIAKNAKICSYIDMPIQHSHTGVIARMARKNTDLRPLIATLKSYEIAIRTTLIVGFPGETEEEFAHLLDFVNEMKFWHMGVFMYSKEDGTVAADLSNQVRASEKKSRYSRLTALQTGIVQTNTKKLIGKTIQVMVDGSIIEGNGKYTGRTEWDAYEIDGAVHFTAPYDLLSGDTVQVRITATNGCDIYGVLVND
ncbi:MAG: 30S ribosomal protein S12 methylthiotransferase RimO [Turicibacter sp.]|nr:30S ribosomal protein S12 methylthiotransferase RimO [Turicibacter sp.]